MRNMAVVNMKGGVGKTTTAVHLAAGLGARGLRTLLIDADPQGTVGQVLAVRSTTTIREVMLGEAAAMDAIVRDVRPNLSVITATPAAFALDTALAGAVQRETLLSRRLADLRGFDAVVIDASPAMSLLTYNALLASREIVMPVGMDPLSVTGASQTLDGVREIRALWPDRALRLAAVVPTSVNMQTYAARAALEALEQHEELGGRLFRAGIRQCIDLVYAAAARQTIWEYAPRSRAAEDYDRFIDWMLAGDAVERRIPDGREAATELQPRAT
jgi:chromosome partitioning protein